MCEQLWSVPLTFKLLMVVPPFFCILTALVFIYPYPITEETREATQKLLVDRRYVVVWLIFLLCGICISIMLRIIIIRAQSTKNDVGKSESMERLAADTSNTAGTSIPDTDTDADELNSGDVGDHKPLLTNNRDQPGF